MAPALYGSTNIMLGFGAAGEPGWSEVSVFRSEGARYGEEKERR
jgi:hypothetical protein